MSRIIGKVRTKTHFSGKRVNEDLECSLQHEVNCPQCVYRVLAPMRDESETPFKDDFAGRDLIRFFKTNSVFQVAVNVSDV